MERKIKREGAKKRGPKPSGSTVKRPRTSGASAVHIPDSPLVVGDGVSSPVVAASPYGEVRGLLKQVQVNSETKGSGEIHDIYI